MAGGDVKSYGPISYTTTGSKEAYEIPPTDTVSVGVVVGSACQYDIEVQLLTDGNWYKEVEDATISNIYVLSARVKAVRLNIDSITGTTQLEIVHAHRSS